MRQFIAGTGGSYLVLGGGITYAGPRTPSDRAAPPEAFIMVRQVSSSSEIRVPKMLEVRTGVRVAFRLWGDPAGTAPATGTPAPVADPEASR